MPKKVIPTKFAYRGFTSSLIDIGFMKIGSKEEERFLKKHNINLENAPRTQDVYDDIYVFYNLNGYRAKVRTTITAEPFKVSTSDAAWIIIENERGEAVMYSQPVHRTKFFFKNLLSYAEIFQHIVNERPLCKCGADINIKKSSLRKYEYHCSMSQIDIDHDDSMEVYDFICDSLPRRLQLFSNIKFSKEKYNRKFAIRKMKIFGSRILMRKRWTNNS